MTILNSIFQWIHNLKTMMSFANISIWCEGNELLFDLRFIARNPNLIFDYWLLTTLIEGVRKTCGKHSRNYSLAYPKNILFHADFWKTSLLRRHRFIIIKYRLTCSIYNKCSKRLLPTWTEQPNWNMLVHHCA